MKTRTTILLLIVVLALAAYIKFYESQRPNTAEAIQQSQKVVNFDRPNITGIIIQNGDDKIELKWQDTKWRIEVPFKDQADASVVSNLLTTLEDWQKWSTIPADVINKDKDQLEQFGLSKAKLRLKLTGKDAPPEILLGNDGALEGKMYVRLADKNDVFLTDQSVRSVISKKPEEFRDQKLIGLSTAQIARVLIKTPVGEMELSKSGDHWEILKPLRARGDDQKIADLLAQLTTARIGQFVADDHGDLQPYGLAEPRGSITLFVAEDKSSPSAAKAADQGQLLQIGGAPENQKEQVYVRSASRNAVYTLPKKIEEILDAKPADLRDHHLLRFETDILDRITIEGGKNKTVLARDGENWTMANRNNQPANASEVGRLIDLLQNERVTRFVEDVASDLPKYGLDKPTLQLTLSSFSSENTAETKAGEQPFATLALGKTEGEEVYARLGDEPFIVAVRRVLLEHISADPLSWQELAVFNLKPDDVTKLSVTTDHQEALVRGANKEWGWEKGAGPINQGNVESLLKTVTTLRAARWIGQTAPDQGLENPRLTVTFDTANDKKSHRLVVGGSANGGMWFAHTDDRDGTFVISVPDFETLRAPLAAPPSTATPAGTP